MLQKEGLLGLVKRLVPKLRSKNRQVVVVVDSCQDYFLAGSCNFWRKLEEANVPVQAYNPLLNLSVWTLPINSYGDETGRSTLSFRGFSFNAKLNNHVLAAAAYHYTDMAMYWNVSSNFSLQSK